MLNSKIRIRHQTAVNTDLKQPNQKLPTGKKKQALQMFSILHYTQPRKAKFDFRHFHTGIFCTNVHKIRKEKKKHRIVKCEATKQISTLIQRVVQLLKPYWPLI